MQRTNLRAILRALLPKSQWRGCHAPCSGHVEPGSHSSDHPGPRLLTLQLQPHGRRFRALGGPGLRLQPPLHVVAASQLPHDSFATRVAPSAKLAGNLNQAARLPGSACARAAPQQLRAELEARPAGKGGLGGRGGRTLSVGGPYVNKGARPRRA